MESIDMIYNNKMVSTMDGEYKELIATMNEYMC